MTLSAGNAGTWARRYGALIRTVFGVSSYDRFGRALAPAGDLNSDGVPDLWVGAPARFNQAAAGRVYAISGANGSVVLNLTRNVAGDRFGWSLAVLLRTYRERVSEALGAFPHGTRGYETLAEVLRGTRPSQLALANHLGIDRTVMTYLIDDLEQDGLVERRSGGDRLAGTVVDDLRVDVPIRAEDAETRAPCPCLADGAAHFRLSAVEALHVLRHGSSSLEAPGGYFFLPSLRCTYSSE